MKEDDYDFELHMELSQSKPQKKLDDTLDFYKENLPLNAVEKLMNESQNEENKENNKDDLKSSYNRFISAYNEKDIGKETGLKVPNPRKRTRSEAESEFLNDIHDKHDVFNYDYTKPKSSFGKIFVALLFFIFVCVIATLVFKINSLNNQIADIKLKLNENTKAKEDLQEALIENENLKKMVEDLSNNKTTTANNSSAQTQNTSSTSGSSSETVYIVKNGDTLSSISEHFYGSTSFYNKIVERNKLTSENLSENQKLIIPEK